MKPLVWIGCCLMLGKVFLTFLAFAEDPTITLGLPGRYQGGVVQAAYMEDFLSKQQEPWRYFYSELFDNAPLQAGTFNQISFAEQPVNPALPEALRNASTFIMTPSQSSISP